MTQRILLGKFPSGDNSPNGYGLRISQAGYDVTTPNPDNERLIFNSDWQDALALAKTSGGSDMVGTLSVGAGGTSTFDHNLGYIPFASAFVNIGGRGWEKYQGSNVLFSRYVNTPSYPVFNGTITTNQTWQCCENPEQVYSFSGNVMTNAQFKVTNSQVIFYCSEAASLYYMIYRMKAF